MICADSNMDFNTLGSICEWLDDGTTPDDLQIETQRPWARTYRLNTCDGQRFLKDLPPIQASALAAMPLLSEQFPNVVPQTAAVEPARGLLLLEDHGGTDMGRRPSTEQKLQILQTYAGIQVEAKSSDELIAVLPRVELNKLVPQLLTFLDPNGKGPADFGPALAKHFFDSDRCQYYHQLFESRADRLSALIAASDRLPVTVNHCDLRAGNIAVREDGELVIYDWDEAVAGPAGMSLHNFFSGCAIPSEMLLHPSTVGRNVRSQDRKLLGGYLRTLASQGYAEPEALNAGIPGAICAGVIQYLLSYARFLPVVESYREDIADILRRRLNDLLSLGDLLHTESSRETVDLCEDYWNRDRGDRACDLMAMYTRTRPFDLDMHLRYAEDLQRADEIEETDMVYQDLVKQFPEEPRVARDYGKFLLEELRLEAAQEQFLVALELGAAPWEIDPSLDETTELLEVCSRAERADEIPAIRISQAEQSSGQLNPRRRRLAVRLFKKYGTLMIENAFPVELVQQLHTEYLSRYQHYFTNDKKDDALKVGSKRYMITVDVDGPFNSPQVYANSFIEPIVRNMLGEKMILGGFNSVCSLPDSQNMRIHKDHPALFPEMRNPDSLPSFAITAVVSMRGFNSTVGTTRVYKGSHNVSSNEARKMDHQDPEGPPGSCLLMDYRLTHQGRANRSDDVRPILTMIYHRPWFRDIVNYGMQEPLRISDEAYAEVPEQFQQLFAWTRDEGPSASDGMMG